MTTEGRRSCSSTPNSGRSSTNTPPTALEPRRCLSAVKVFLTVPSTACGEVAAQGAGSPHAVEGFAASPAS